MNKNLILLFIGAIIWGLAFVAQSVSNDYIGVFFFNFLRFIIGAFVLLPFVFKKKKHFDKNILISGFILGAVVAIFSTAQQYGLIDNTTGKGGFITSLYIAFVPILNFFLFKKKINKYTILGILMALFGLYLLIVNERIEFNHHDIFLLIGAIFISLQIIFVERYAHHEAINLAFVQFVVAGLICGIISLFFEKNYIENIYNALGPILYTGVLSTGVAYTFQIIGQKGNDCTIVSLVMSLEAVFALIGGVIILKQNLSFNELLGCIVIMAATVLIILVNKEGDEIICERFNDD